MKRNILHLLLLFTISTFAQQNLSLEQCYQLVETNYPLAKQKALLGKQNAIDLDVVKTDKLPQVDFSAQATYQSDVIAIPIATIDPLNKDQYRATLSVNQLIYADGLIDASLKAKTATLKTQQKQVEVDLYQLKKQVNQLYFSILLFQEKKLLLLSKRKQLEVKLKEIASGIKNGLLMPASDKILAAELLKVKQQLKEVDSTKMSLIKTLSTLVGSVISTEIDFENPLISIPLNKDILRPELELFKLKKEEIKSSIYLLSKQNAPKLFVFANGGYGNPGLNALDNSFQGFYTVGIKLNWHVFDWNANKKKRKSLTINKAIIDSQMETFELNTHIELDQQQSDIEKLLAFIISDKEIIKLRKVILKSTESQLRNGVITSSDYITELTHLYEDENNLKTHKIELQLLKANYTITKGL